MTIYSRYDFWTGLLLLFLGGLFVGRDLGVVQAIAVIVYLIAGSFHLIVAFRKPRRPNKDKGGTV